MFGLAAILTGIAASALMQTMLSTAMPRIAVDLDAGDVYGWVFAAYLLTSTLPMPAFSHLADHRGRRTLFVWGIAGFMLGTAGAALASSGAFLVAARIVQGLGAAALVPAALGAIGDLTGETRGRFFGTVGVVQVLANVIGPLLGGWFTDESGWRFGLWAIVPVCLVSMLAAFIGLPDEARSSWLDAWRSLDLLEPVRRVKRDRQMRAIAWSALGVGAILMTTTAAVPLLIQGRLAGSATSSSGALIALMAGVGIGSALGGRAAERIPALARRTSWIAIITGCVGLVVASLLHTSLAWISIVVGLTGLGVGTLTPILLVQAQVIGGETAAARASTVVQLARNLGGAIGTALLGIVAVQILG